MAPDAGSGEARRARRPRRLLWVTVAVVLAYLALAVPFTVLTPAWENNDEGDHVGYAEHVAATGDPPRIAYANGIESHQPPLYYYLTAGWQELLGTDPFRVDIPGRAPGASPTSMTYQLSHGYTSEQHRQAVWVHELRVVSLACGLATVLAAVATGWLLTASLSFTAALGSAVALWPKFLVVSAAVTNSALVIALCAWAIPAFILWERTGCIAFAAATGTLLGAAALTQETALPVAVLVLALLVAMAWRRREWRPPLAAAACFAAVCGWWYVRNHVIYGDPLASGATEAYLRAVPALVRDPVGLSWGVVRSSLPVLFRSTWYDGGWNQLLLPSILNTAVWIVAAVTAIAALASKLRGWLLLATCAIGSVIGWLLIIRYTTQAEGRYLLVAIVAWAAFLVGGSEWVGRLGGWRSVSLWLWPAIFLGVDAYVLAHFLIPLAEIP
jgi:hypothetical protein